MFALQNLIKRDLKKLAANITLEQGKTLVDAEGDVTRGLQVSQPAHCLRISCFGELAALLSGCGALLQHH